jgi:hypothetical protein
MVPGLLRAAENRRLWQYSTFSWVKRVPAEMGAPANDQPVHLETMALANALSTVRFVTGYKEAALFDRTEAKEAAEAMVDALSMAQPGDDLELLSTAIRGGGFLSTTAGVTARFFVKDGKFNLIVQDPRNEYMAAYNFANQMPDFEYGSRKKKADGVVLKAPGAEVRRPDWILVPMSTLTTPVSQPVPAPVPAPVPQPVPVPVPQPAPVPVPVPVPVPAPVVAAAASTPAVVSSSVDYAVQGAEKFVIFTTPDRTLTLPDPGGANANRILTVLSSNVPGRSNKLTILCGSGSKLKSAADGYASAKGSCTLDAVKGQAPNASITCVSDGQSWFCQ